MKKSERRMILILIIVTIAVIVVLVKMKGKNDKVADKPIVNGDDSTIVTPGPGEENPSEPEEFVQVLEDGKKLNVSDKLSETKTFSNYEVSNIQLTEENGQSQLLADVKNIGSVKAEVVLIDITLLDKEGNEIATIGGIIGDVEPGETVQLNASATTDFANAYDFTIKISENQ